LHDPGQAPPETPEQALARANYEGALQRFLAQDFPHAFPRNRHEETLSEAKFRDNCLFANNNWPRFSNDPHLRRLIRDTWPDFEFPPEPCFPRGPAAPLALGPAIPPQELVLNPGGRVCRNCDSPYHFEAKCREPRRPRGVQKYRGNRAGVANYTSNVHVSVSSARAIGIAIASLAKEASKRD